MKKILIATFALCTLLTSCKGKKSSSENEQQGVETTENSGADTEKANLAGEAVCILDKLSVRETPGKKGKWVTSLSLGEQITFLGEKMEDPASKKEYSKIKLIDGKEGWTRSSFIVVNGKVGAMLENTTVYKRPDLLTKTDKQYSPMDIIAVMTTQGDWMQVKGKRRIGEYVEEAWIKSSNISNSPVDVATAKYAAMALSKETMTDKIKALQELVNNSDLSESKFISLIGEKIKDLQEKNSTKDIIEKAKTVE